MNNIARLRENLFKDFMEDWVLFNPRMRTLPTRLPPDDFPVDIRETDTQYLIEAEMPGLKKDEIKIEIDGKNVTISAEVKREAETKDDGHMLQHERYFGLVSRGFAFAQDVDTASAKASYQNGVLKLELSKRSPSTGQRIEIQ